MSSQIEDKAAPVPDNLVAEIERTGSTNAEVARGIGVSERQITRWRGGQVPRYEFVVRLARFFGRETEWFYTEHEQADGVVA